MLARLFGLLAAVMALTSTAAGMASASGKVALVIGNSRYEQAPALRNPANDARAFAQTLEQMGFDTVTLKIDQGYLTMRRAVRDFGNVAKNADIALVYYAGPGMEFGGENYLVPVDARLQSDQDLDYEAITLSSVLKSVENAKQLKLVILDACRNNPLAMGMQVTTAQTRSVAQGLSHIEPRGDVLVAYAARDGTTASDGDGEHSPYTSALLQHIGEPGIDVRLVLGEVRDSVLASTHNRQEPHIYGTLGGAAIYLVPPRLVPSQGTVQMCEAALGEARRTGNEDKLAALVSVFGTSDCGKEATAALEQLTMSKAAEQARTRVLPDVHDFQECADCPSMVVIPSGTFMMGSPDNEEGRGVDEGPQVRMQIPSPFAMSRTEITRGQWRAFVKDTHRQAPKDCRALVYDPAKIEQYESGKLAEEWKATGEFSWENTNYPQDDNHPAACISHDDALAYADWLSERTRHRYRLPSEAEWEYASRGGTEWTFFTGNRLGPKRANYFYPGSYAGSPTGPWLRGTTRVGTFRPNPFGLYDMNGNVWEWVADCAGAKLSDLDPEGKPYVGDDCSEYGMRGGAFWTNPVMLRSAARYAYARDLRGAAAGFRLIRELPDGDPELAAARAKSQSAALAKPPVKAAGAGGGGGQGGGNGSGGGGGSGQGNGGGDAANAN